MKDFLKSGVVGNIEYNQLQENRKRISETWDRLGFTQGLVGVQKENIATLFENTARNLINEATDASNSGSFETVVFPIVRRVFAKLLANDIVSVQALNLPIGKLFYIKPVTSERQWEGLDAQGNIQDGSSAKHTGMMGYERNDRNFQNAGKGTQGAFANRYYLPDDVIVTNASQKPVPTFNAVYDEPGTGNNTVPPFGTAGFPLPTAVRNTPVVTQFLKASLYDLFYNDFLYDNSKGRIWIKVAQAATPVVLTSQRDFQPPTTANYPPSRNDGTIRNVILEVTGFNNYNAGKLIGPDGNEMDSESFLASLRVLAAVAIPDAANRGHSTFLQFENIPYRVMTQKYGKAIVERENVCNADGKIYLELDLTKPTVDQGLTIDGYIGIDPATVIDLTTFLVTWAQYDSLELETEIAEVSFKIEGVTISVEERKLRATWSPELAQDVAAFHNIDAEAELTALLSEQVAAEIDREILRDLRHASAWQLRWDHNGWRRMAGFSTNYTQKDWNQELITCVNKISAQIHKSTLMGGANFIVVSPEISAVFDNLEYFHATNAAPEEDQYSLGIEKIGTLQGRYQTYRDPYSPHWSVLIGHKGKSMLDTGYIYAPYVPLQLTPTIYNQFNFAPVKGIMTRYAKKVVNNKFYGQVRVDGLTVWNVNEFR
jgi:hypothetical protein